MLTPGDIVTVDFPGVRGIKRRPAVVVSTKDYHNHRPDVIVGLLTSQTQDAAFEVGLCWHEFIPGVPIWRTLIGLARANYTTPDVRSQ
jgi:mRNA-degrading endonuclease toxin of MazEF toxin-antitoxin module